MNLKQTFHEIFFWEEKKLKCSTKNYFCACVCIKNSFFTADNDDQFSWAEDIEMY